MNAAARSALRSGLTDAAARQGWYGGLLLGVFEMVVLSVGNLVLAPTGETWTSGDGVGFSLLACYAVAFVLIGVRGARRSETRSPGARAGAIAGFCVAVAFVGTFAVLDNVFYETIIRRPSHLGETHASLNHTLLGATIFALAVVTCVAALLGEFGGSIVRGRRESRPGPMVR